MAPYDVNLVCWRVVHDQEFYDAILKNPAEAIRDCGLSEAERVALFDQDAPVSLQASTPAPLIRSVSARRCLRSPHTRQGMSQAAGAKTEGTETDKTRCTAAREPHRNRCRAPFALGVRAGVASGAAGARGWPIEAWTAVEGGTEGTK